MIISTTLVLLWSYLEKYESNTPEFYIHKFLSNLHNENISVAMKQVEVEETKFFSTKDYQTYMQNILGNDFENAPITQISNNNDKQKFEVIGINNQSIMLELTKTSNKKQFGLDSYTIKQQEIPLKALTIFAPSNIKVMANDVVLTQEYLISQVKTVACFDVLKEQNMAPGLIAYQLNGFMVQPKISVQGLTVQDYHISQKKEELMINVKTNLAEQKKLEEIAVASAKAYANFISRDAKFSDYSKYLYKQTSYYDVIKSFDNYWYIDHDSFAFENMKVENILAYSDIHFSAEVSFEYIIERKAIPKDDITNDARVRGYIKRTYPTKYKISFIKQDNTYKIVNLEIA